MEMKVVGSNLIGGDYVGGR